MSKFYKIPKTHDRLQISFEINLNHEANDSTTIKKFNGCMSIKKIILTMKIATKNEKVM